MRKTIAALAASLAAAGSAAAQAPPLAPPARGQVEAIGQSSSPVRTEIVHLDNWTVTCRDPAPPQGRKLCSAMLQIAQTRGEARQVVFAWIVGLDPQGRLTTLLQTPTGIAVEDGIQLAIGQRPARRVGYTICEPQRCEARLAMDEAFVRELTAGEDAVATIRSSNGQSIRLTVQTKGIARVIPMIRP